jgi:hypothetical protein
VYIRTDGESWEVEARAGNGQSKVHSCPGRQSAQILAEAWMTGAGRWQPAEGDPRLA